MFHLSNNDSSYKNSFLAVKENVLKSEFLALKLCFICLVVVVVTILSDPMNCFNNLFDFKRF